MSIDSEAQMHGGSDVQDSKKKHRKSPKTEVNSSLGDLSIEERKKLEKKKKKEKRKRAEEETENNENVKAEKAERKEKRKKEKGTKLREETLHEEIGGEVANGQESHQQKADKKKKKGEDDVESAEDADRKERKRKRKVGAEAKTPVRGEADGADMESKKKKRRKERMKDAESSTTSNGATPDLTMALPVPSLASSVSHLSEAEVSAYLAEHSITVNCGSSSGTSIPENLRPCLAFSALFPRIPADLHGALSTFKEPTPIQACTWPPILEGRDVVGIAETGSGKTLAFGIPGVSRLVSSLETQSPTGDVTSTKPSKKSKSKLKGGPKARISILALAPTRELALQTHETFSLLGGPFGLSSVALYGGVDKEPQRRALVEEGAAMVVGTPGRILDLLNEGACDLSGVNYLVLDEADRMLDKGFENDIRSIIEHTCPSEKRQTLMFSATWPEAVRRLASTFQRDPVRVTVGSDDLTANRRVEQVVEVFEDQFEKDNRLLSHLRTLKARKGEQRPADESRILVFVLYKKEAARVEQNFRRQGFSVVGIHGDLSQGARIAALDEFKSGRTQIMVATDVAARGLDIPNVGTVINYSFPLTIEDYIHRIGRTGRGGRSGKSITFFTGDNHERALAGELARVLRESGFDADPLKIFPMTIKKKTHSVYGAFYRDDIPSTAVPTRLKF